MFHDTSKMKNKVVSFVLMITLLLTNVAPTLIAASEVGESALPAAVTADSDPQGGEMSGTEDPVTLRPKNRLNPRNRRQPKSRANLHNRNRKKSRHRKPQCQVSSRLSGRNNKHKILPRWKRPRNRPQTRGGKRPSAAHVAERSENVRIHL